MPKLAQGSPLAFNRVRAVLLHIPHYTVAPKAQLALETGVSQNAMSRMVRGKLNPSYLTAELICRAINRRSSLKLPVEEIFSVDGYYPTPSACVLMGCKGCLPPEAWDERSDRLKPEWRHQKPGEWSKTKPGEWSRVEADPASPGQTI